ncbi:MAG TPA: helix-turn-helix domain-containing protein [Bryobacteraceae bacterium]|nr:helix-turn-helix domain-containing protein [Bryobacteraceae bacterium]
MLLKDCPVSVALHVIGGKWKPLLLNELKSGTLRYGELRRRVPEASPKVLTEQLRQLEALGIVQRTSAGSATPRTEYKLTPYGRTLSPILARLCKWGELHRQRCE